MWVFWYPEQESDVWINVSFVLRIWPLHSTAMSELQRVRLRGKRLPMSLCRRLRKANAVTPVRGTLTQLFRFHWQKHTKIGPVFSWFLFWSSSLLFPSESEEFLKYLYQNEQCGHLRDGSAENRKCFCAIGYKLVADGRQCIVGSANTGETRLSTDSFGENLQWNEGKSDSCIFFLWSILADGCPHLKQQTVVGQTRLVGANHCPTGECPWLRSRLQARREDEALDLNLSADYVLVQLHRHSHCGGILIRPDWVIAAVHCVTGK